MFERSLLLKVKQFGSHHIELAEILITIVHFYHKTNDKCDLVK